jgi:RecA/RadA recombinase
MRRKKEQPEASAPEQVAVETDRSRRLKGLAAVSKKFGAWKPARDVLVRVEAVPTIFCQFDHATRVGGMPLARFATVHGPSHHGKTAWVLGLGYSFLLRDHFFGYVDAERTTAIDWVEKLMGKCADHPGFVGSRPTSYEATVDSVREILTGIGEAREKGEVPKDTTGLVVVDSIRKLVPQKILDRLLKEGAEGDKGSIDGFGGRAAQIKAALNASWLDEVTMLLEQTNTALIAIARETDDPNADANAVRYGTNWKVTGGKALIFDSSLVMRVTRDAWLRQGSGPDAEIVGERHQVRIWKSKIAGKDDKHTDCNFSTSNGVLIPEGFDRARDVLELAQRFELVKSVGSGSWLSWNGQRWNGQHAAVRKLTGEPESLDELERQVRQKFGEKPAEQGE